MLGRCVASWLELLELTAITIAMPVRAMLSRCPRHEVYVYAGFVETARGPLGLHLSLQLSSSTVKLGCSLEEHAELTEQHLLLGCWSTQK